MIQIKKTVINKIKEEECTDKFEFVLEEEFEDLLDLQMYLKDMAQQYATPGMNVITNIHLNTSVKLNALTVTIFYQDMTTSIYFNAHNQEI